MLGQVEVDDPPAVVGEHNEDAEDAKASGGRCEEVDGDQVGEMVGEKRPPGLRGLGDGRFGMRRETGRSAMSMPSFTSSPWMRGAPHKGFAAAIFLTSAAIWALMQGRPRGGRPERRGQYSRKRRRCHHRTVSGGTNTRGCLHPVQTLARTIHQRQSVGRSLGRGAVRLYTASCWRKARFSKAS